MSGQARRREQDGVEPRSAVRSGDHRRPVFAPARDHAVDRPGLRSGPSASTTTAACASSGSGEPQRSDAPGPRSHWDSEPSADVFQRVRAGDDDDAVDPPLARTRWSTGPRAGAFGDPNR
jgi:hypothetical protein